MGGQYADASPSISSMMAAAELVPRREAPAARRARALARVLILPEPLTLARLPAIALRKAMSSGCCGDAFDEARGLLEVVDAGFDGELGTAAALVFVEEAELDDDFGLGAGGAGRRRRWL
jgi:hypothetical protein